jgi:hypothetical protein
MLPALVLLALGVIAWRRRNQSKGA